MRLHEFIEQLPALINKTADVDGIKVSINTNTQNATAYASAQGKRLGYVEFDRAGDVLVPYDLAVDDKYRGQGIAAVMYDYVKSLGFTIKASPDQTDDGKYFWKKNRGNKRVWETDLNELALGNGLPAQPVNSGRSDEAMWIVQTQANEYLVKFSFDPEDADNPGEGGMNTAFYGRDKNGQWTMDITNVGEKELTQLIATVARLLAEFLKQHKHLTYIEIGGKDPRRDRLYQRLIQQNLQRFFPGQQFDIVPGGINRVLSEIARIPQGDFGDADTLIAPKYDVEKKPLPGGNKFTYAVGKPGAEDLEIMIFDGDNLAAELDLFYTQDVTKVWRVSTVAVNPQYRSQGLGKALYGIALSVLKLTLEAGDTQTKHGQAMWLMLNSIPGVEVVGYTMEPTNKYKAHKGDSIIAQDKQWTRYTFPVAPGKQSMRSRRPGTGVYSSQASMLAKWTGQ